MTLRRLLLWFYRLSWKKLLGFSSLALAIAVIPLVIQSANSPTRTRSEAALIHPSPQPVTTEFVTPKGAPEIYLVDHFFGKAGDAVLVHGANLGGASQKTSVSLAGQVIPADNLVSWTSDYIEFKLPETARSGKVGVNILGQTAEWPGTFWVTDETTTAELRLEKISDREARLLAKNINGRLLMWLLVFQGEDKTIDISPPLQAQIKTLPIGRIYELNFNVVPAGEWTTLATVTKKPDQQVGIARAEAADTLIPIKSHPLYVSF